MRKAPWAVHVQHMYGEMTMRQICVLLRQQGGGAEQLRKFHITLPDNNPQKLGVCLRHRDEKIDARRPTRRPTRQGSMACRLDRVRGPWTLFSSSIIHVEDCWLIPPLRFRSDLVVRNNPFEVDSVSNKPPTDPTGRREWRRSNIATGGSKTSKKKRLYL